MENHSFKPARDAPCLKFDWGELHWYADAQFGNSREQTFGKCVLNPGGSNPRHYHPNCEEILHVAEGMIDHYIEGQGWFPMETGDTITIHQGVWHCARNRGEGQAVLYICFSSADRETIGEDAEFSP